MRSDTKEEEGESASRHPSFSKWTSDVQYSGAKKVVPGRIYSMVIHPKTDNLLVHFFLEDMMYRLLLEIRMVIWDSGLSPIPMNLTVCLNLKMA